MESLWSDVVRRQSATDWRWSTTVEELLVDNGRAVGVIVRDEAGHRSELRSQSVILATGGFAGDLDVVLDHAPHLRAVERLLVGGGVGARGTGHAMLAKLGAALDHLDHIWTYTYAIPDYREPSGRRGLVVRGLDDAIWVNREGRRFHDESRPGPGTATPALLAQDPATCWAIVDRTMALGMRIADPHFRSDAGSPHDRIDELLASSPFIHSASSPEALARAAGIAADAFAATIREWNGLVASGTERDPLTGRSLAGVSALTGSPLYAIQFYPLVRKNLGGVRTDLRCRVLNTGGAPIPGLFAAGELAGFGGGHLSGRRALEGIMIGGSLFGGRIAGAMAGDAAGFGPTADGPTALRSPNLV